MIEGAVALVAHDDNESAEIHVARKGLEVMPELSGNGKCCQSKGPDNRPMSLATRTAVANAVATTAVGIHS